MRIWQRPHVKVGGRYAFGDGAIVVDAIDRIELSDITPKLARASGFAGLVDLLKVAKHGRGENVYLIEFHYLARNRRRAAGGRSSANTKKRSSS